MRKVAPRLKKLIAIIIATFNFELEGLYQKQANWKWCINFHWHFEGQSYHYRCIIHEVDLFDIRLASIADVVCYEIQEINYYARSIVVGDVTCKNDARSPHLRCAINPVGECQGCQHYEKL